MSTTQTKLDYSKPLYNEGSWCCGLLTDDLELRGRKRDGTDYQFELITMNKRTTELKLKGCAVLTKLVQTPIQLPTGHYVYNAKPAAKSTRFTGSNPAAVEVRAKYAIHGFRTSMGIELDRSLKDKYFTVTEEQRVYYSFDQVDYEFLATWINPNTSRRIWLGVVR